MKQSFKVLAVLTLAACCGCMASTSHSSQSDISSWASGDGDSIPGLDSGSVYRHSRDGSLKLLIWVGGGVQTISTTSMSGTGFSGTKGKGEIRNPAGVVFKVEFEMPDNGPGWIKFDNRTFDLQQGVLFLISATGEVFEAKQVKRDMTKTDVTIEGVKKLAKADEEIRQFFKRTYDEAKAK